MEIARVDVSISTFWDGKDRLFGLTEPLVVSRAGGGLITTAKREWDNVAPKRSEEVDRQLSVVRHLDHLGPRRIRQSGQGFHHRAQEYTRFSVEKIQNKMSLKVVQNGLITIKDCRVPEENHLKEGYSFREAARVLRMTRYLVGWEATGCQMGAYENTLKYAQTTLQFGKPIGSCS
jgi:hypothetical protein